MLKKTIIVLFVIILFFSCGKKGEPYPKNPEPYYKKEKLEKND